MRIEVTAVDADGIVSFRCANGIGAGVWESAEPPTPGRAYHVEIDVEEAGLHAGATTGISTDSRVTLGGVWHVTEDGATYLRIGDYTVSVESIDQATDGAPTKAVAERTAVRLFPYEA